MMPLAFLVLVGALLLYACYTDFTGFHIPNAVPSAIALLFLPFALSAPLSMREMVLHLAAGMAVLAVTFGLYTAGLRFGGGDAKLFSALALWCGFGKLLPFLVNVSIIGGAMGMALMALHRSGLCGWMTAQGWHLPFFDEKDGKLYLPYGVAIATGFLLTTI